MYDGIVIGAGIIGSLIARELTMYGCKIALVEKNSDIANEVTAANSAIVHCGHDPKENTLKAKLNVLGAKLYPKLCQQLQVDYCKCGAFIVATNQEELIVLNQLEKQAKDRLIQVERLTAKQAQLLEPNLSNQVLSVLSLPDTAIIMPWEVAIASVEEAMHNGMDCYLNETVKQIIKEDHCFQVITNHLKLNAKFVVNAAGFGALSLYESVTGEIPCHITPRRGQYYVLDEKAEDFVSRVIYPVPTKKGKGVLCVPTTHGNILLGPTAEVIEDAEDKATTQQGLDEIKNKLKLLMKNVPYQYMVREYAGIRPSPDTHDFIIKEAEHIKGFYSCIGIESPGIASAPAIAKYVRELINKRFPLSKNNDYVHNRKSFVKLSRMDEKTRNELILKDPSFGKIVCRCRGISEGEIKDCILRDAGAQTIKAVKRRVFSGTGNCQGGFCEPHVVKLLAKYTNQKLTEIGYEDIHDPILHERGDEEDASC